MPRGLYPRSGPRPTRSDAERRIYRALSREGALPEGSVAWHSFAFSHDNRDYEIDFLYAHPDRGILGIEVKGGQITLSDGHYHQSGRRLESAGPAAQARGSLYALREYLLKSWGEYPPFNHALWFPDMEEPIAIKAAELDGRVLGYRSLQYPKEALDALSDRLFADLRQPRDASFIARLHELWGERTPARPISRGSRFVTHLNERALLDEQQRRTLGGLIENERCIIKGAAGTGKSQLARLAAKERAAAGQRVLLTCFTEGLAQILARSCASPLIEVATVRALAVSFAAEEIESEAKPTTAAEWEKLTLRGAEILEQRGAPWDVIIIDEAQDFGENDWLFILAAGGAEKPLWIFLDEAQRFWSDRILPDWVLDRAARYTLSEQYRVPSALLLLAEGLLMPEGEERRVTVDRAREIAELDDQFEIISREKPARALASELGRAIHVDGIRPEHIAILSLRGAGPTNTVASAERIGGFEVARVSDEDAHEKIVADTFLRFKGLERPLIFITDLEEVSERHRERLHIALTRALDRAVILTTKEAAEAIGLG